MNRSILLALFVCAGLAGCRPADPDPSSEAYREAVYNFYSALARIQAGEDLGAEERLLRVTELAPAEPAAWANLGLLAMRRNDLDAAAARLERARSLAPDAAPVLLLSGLMEQVRGDADAAEAYLRQAVEVDPENLRALYALATLLRDRGTPEATADALRLIDRILDRQPDNLAALLEKVRLAAALGEAETLRATVDRLAAQAEAWPPEAREQLQALRQAPPDQAAQPAAFLENILRREAAYREDLAALKTPDEQIGTLVDRFLRLPNPTSRPAPPDSSLTFVPDSLAFDGGPWDVVRVVLLTPEDLPAVLAARAEAVRLQDGTTLPFPGGGTSPSPSGLAAIDYDYDFLVDLALAGAGGFRLFRQHEDRSFSDVTPRLDLPAAIREAAYDGVWTADLDLEGDLDLVLAPRTGSPRVLRNDGDGTFTPWPLFDDVPALRGFAWADLDADGDPDAMLLDDGGRLHVLLNERAGRFRARALPADLGAVRAFTVADLDSDARIDLLVWTADGTVWQLRTEGAAPDAGWGRSAVATWGGLPAGAARPGTARLVAADFDNNGGLDLLASTEDAARVWLSDEDGAFFALPDPLPHPVFAVADLSGTGRLDLVGRSAEGQPVVWTNLGRRLYHGKSIRPLASSVAGDRRINPFGLGGTVEVRTGLLFQKQPITEPMLHFGLAEHLIIDVVRITWPNGDVQAEFDLLSDQTVEARQRLKGSCPWLFTFDGERMRFVTDVLWRSPLGLKINAQETAGVMMTEDRVKIRGDQLAARDGVYDLRITAELWETHFFDHVALLVVDHPAGTEVFVDERFVFPPPDLDVRALAPLRPVAGVRDGRGRDVTERVRERDARYLKAFEVGRYQGVAEPHVLEIDLPEDVPTDGPLWLVGQGWLRPTDSSINVALSQEPMRPQGLRLEVPDGRGGWRVWHENLGFPAGKLKTVLLDLTGAFAPGVPRRVRLHTNMEIYWDRLAVAQGRPGADLRVQRLAPETADLRYRGFSVTHEADRSSPEIPTYDTLAGTAPVWQDLIGYYTRFGDVRPLLETVDDRYVIMNAGDELVLRFPAPPPPPEGWVRDFVFISDGWVKDGDYNTAFSKTVLPLPSHDDPDYATPPTRLEDDPVYRRHAADWQQYHTRYVTPERFHAALRPR